MKKSLGAKIKKLNLNKFNLDKKEFLIKPIKVIKKIKINKLKNITSFSFNKTFDSFSRMQTNYGCSM